MGAAPVAVAAGFPPGTVLPEGEMPGLPGLVAADGRPVPGFAADEFFDLRRCETELLRIERAIAEFTGLHFANLIRTEAR